MSRYAYATCACCGGQAIVIRGVKHPMGESNGRGVLVRVRCDNCRRACGYGKGQPVCRVKVTP